jgi:S1-C subfamily serine protease
MTTPPLASSEAAALDAYSHVVVSVADLLIPSVASLTVMQNREGGAGSAVVLTPDGYLLTSAHVVSGARSGTAIFADGRQSRFQVVGADALSDLAVLRVILGDLQAATLGDADNLRVGQLVVAVGSPLGFAGSVTAGVVSALGRSLPARGNRNVRLVENVIQTDAALHPGNSGGALADSAGRVVGVSTAVVGPGIGQGLGMAVPVNDATRRIIAALIGEGRVRRALLGIAGGPRPLPPKAARVAGRERGVEVVQVVPDSPAARAGIRQEDIILEVDGIPIEDAGDIQGLMTAELIDKEITVQVFRGGDIVSLRPVPVELDD